jgi:DNA-directed RNA polymerase subunit beta'
VAEKSLKAGQAGIVVYHDLNPVQVPDPSTGEVRTIVLKRNGEVAVTDDRGREIERYKVPYGSSMLIKEGGRAERGQELCEWDPHLTPMLAEVEGFVRFQDITEGETVRQEQERAGAKYVVIEHKGEKHPQIIIEDRDGHVLDYHYLPAKARIEVDEGQHIIPGMLLARQPRAMTGTQDITGGLPRVTEIFDARKPKEPAVLAEISGTVEIRADKRRGKMTIIIRGEGGMEKEHHVPQDKQLLVHAGDYVEAGDPLIEGPLVPHDILRIKGEEALQSYLLIEVQAVYRSQNVNINDQHIETIISQMLRKVKVDSPGDSKFLPGEVVDKFRFRAENERLSASVRIVDAGDTECKEGDVVLKTKLQEINDAVEEKGGEPAKGKRPKPANAKTLLLGITKASLQSESFISAASFQETTKVLTEASLGGSVDPLIGLKENVILGRLIPAGTAFKPYLEMRFEHLGEPIPEKVDVPQHITEEEIEKVDTGKALDAAGLSMAKQPAGAFEPDEISEEFDPAMALLPRPETLGMITGSQS